MKTILTALMFLGLITLASNVGAEPNTNSLMSVDYTYNTNAQKMYSGYDCYAYTACPNGGAIACHVYGASSAGTACNWWVIPYRAVGCTGYDSYGNWQSYSFSCQ